MKYTLKRAMENPFIHSINNIVTDINEEFIRLTGYTEDELVGKSLEYISSLLRLDAQFSIKNMKTKHRLFIFTKNLKAVEAAIIYKEGCTPGEGYYYIKVHHSPNMENKLPYVANLISENDIGIGVYSITHGILLDLNEKLMELYSIKGKDKLIGKSAYEIIAQPRYGNFAEIFFNAERTLKPYHSKEVRWTDCHGEDRYLDLSLVPVEITKTRYLIITASDITEKVLNRKMVEEQNEELEAIIENMSDSLVIFDQRGDYKKFNKACRDSFIFDTEKTKNIEDLHKQLTLYDGEGNIITVDNSPAKRVLNGERISGYREIIKTNNSVFHTELSGTPIYDSAGSFMAGLILVHDVTDKIKYQQNELIKTQLNLLHNIIENVQVGVIRCSYPDFEITDINNRAYEELLTFNPEAGPISEVRGRNYFETFQDMEENNIINKLQDFWQKENAGFNHVKHYVSGNERFLKVIYQPIIGLNRQIVEFLIIAIDISDEVRAKQNMEEVLKLQEELFTNVAHELKTPLNVIFSTDQLIEYYLKNNLLVLKKDKVANGINVIKQNCYRLTKLINNIVDLSKLESGFLKLNLSNENIVQVTEDIVQSVSDYINERRLNIIFDTNTEEKIISCDCDKVERIILNLLSNAIKFTNPGGSIYVNLMDRGDWVEISVKDTGIGIDEKNQKSIFERFRQVDKSLSRNTEGSGIGLSLVKSIVELHKGTIKVKSEVGKGSTFTVALPAILQADGAKASYFMTNKVEMIKVEFSDIYSF